MLLFETILAIAIFVLALLCPAVGSRLFGFCELWFQRLAQQRIWSVLLVGIAALLLRAMLLPVLPIPQPIVHDEFSYLLMADTFRHLRLTNPAHNLWVHFETFGVIQQPTYQSYASPMQGLILATGRVLLGDPFWGVWLSAGIMCAALTWMLQAWVSPGWALIGGFLAVLRFGVFGYWANSYWGGAAGAIGGALALGTLPRLLKFPRFLYSFVLGCGLLVLANSRPYEGLILSIPVLVVLLWSFCRDRRFSPRKKLGLMLPLLITLLCGAVSMGYYNWRVTGNAFQFPYQLERKTYSSVPYLIWQPMMHRPHYNHQVIQAAYDAGIEGFKTNKAWPGIVVIPVTRAVRVWRFFIGPILTVPILILFVSLPYGVTWKTLSWRARFLCCVVVIFTIGVLGLEATLFSPHYASPFLSAILIVIALSLQQIRKWMAFSRPAGMFITRAVVCSCLFLFLVRCFAGTVGISLPRSHAPAWDEEGPRPFGREIILSELNRLPGTHLVIVRYGSKHNLFHEWVQNEADIDASKIVWARDMGPQANGELIQYYQERKVWLLQPDENPVKIEAYR